MIFLLALEAEVSMTCISSLTQLNVLTVWSSRALQPTFASLVIEVALKLIEVYCVFFVHRMCLNGAVPL